ncbi:transposase [Chryseobacterium kwangjuense]|uniref:Transposase n=1 Tax=Chryseobacterium kwangjuense TaxID=267125 RepID=A0ABW9K8P9_9FLAO
MMNLKNIHIGSMVKAKVEEHEIQISRIIKFFNCSEDEIENMYLREIMDTHKLLRWSKLLGFDFFRIFSGHLMLYAPPAKVNKSIKLGDATLKFRKSVYTEEVKQFILDKITKGEITTMEAIVRYKIPKTTLYKWIKKV